MREGRRPGPSVRVQVTEWLDGSTRRREDRLATEEPLEIRLGWPGHPAERLLVTMRTPGHDFELAAGLTYAEGLHSGQQLHGVAYCTDTALSPEQEYNVVTVTLTGPPGRLPSDRTAMTSACGVCGKQSLEDAAAIGATPQVVDEAQEASLDPRMLVALPDRLREAQRVFDRTGGLHAAGLHSPDGSAVVVREDVGRHNAVDKVIGHSLLHRIDPSVLVLCTSGRVGFEIVQKAAVAAIPAIVAVGAPSSLAVDLARSYGLTVVGFARNGRMVVYSHAARLAPEEPSEAAPVAVPVLVSAPAGMSPRGQSLDPGVPNEQ
ncbi:MAG: Sulfur carrier protein FdhD [uncultured Nocardioidaceae bacterium]|uniref:Sulfur carrier protein FdhD n=1 Tax=uncultured Nocardioidaceae bacterium TaxID=253824 RepID=A0A6J4LXR3_9ACTN|nr:MAG: Sulfur carrier protein FdhD [uncultured Nocardioidaceae bacterium]